MLRNLKIYNFAVLLNNQYQNHETLSFSIIPHASG